MKPIDDVELARLLAILGACWSELDRRAAAATGMELRSGPRGGGRDLSKILAHVLEAEQAYLAKLGSKPPKGDGSTAHVAAHRAAVRAAFMARAMDRPVPEPNLVRVFWTPRYFSAAPPGTCSTTPGRSRTGSCPMEPPATGARRSCRSRADTRPRCPSTGRHRGCRRR